MTQLIILDTETTGFRAPQPVEVGYVKLNALDYYPGNSLLTQSHDTFVSRYKPTKAIDPGAVAIHGIRMADVFDKQVFKFSLLDVPETTEYMLGHNINYDFRAMGKPEIRLKKVCTLKLAKALWPGLASYKLTELMKEFFPNQHKAIVKDAHGALVDCRLCLALVLKAKLEFQFETWEDFYELAGVK